MQVQLFPAEQIRIVKLLVETVIVPRWHPTSWPRSWTTRCRITSPKVPQAVFCLLTALRFHELTTQLPRQIWIAMPRGSHVPGIDYPPIKMVQMTGDAYTAGIEEHLRDGVKLRVYGAAKTVADCFKHRNKIGLDVALEAASPRCQDRCHLPVGDFM